MSTSASKVTSFGNPNVPVPGLPSISDYLGRSVRKTAVANGTHHAGVVPLNAGAGTYDFSLAANQLFNMFFSLDNGATYKKIAFAGIKGATPAATTAAEVAALLNAVDIFAAFFLAANNAGALRITPLIPNSRVKSYFTGPGATVLAGDMTVAVAPGSAIAAASQAGALQSFIVEDERGTPIPGAKVFATSDRATSVFGPMVNGEMISAPGFSGIQMQADANGLVIFYVNDSAAEVQTTTLKPESNTTTYANVMKDVAASTFG